jgi:hypothetical protein
MSSAEIQLPLTTFHSFDLVLMDASFRRRVTNVESVQSATSSIVEAGYFAHWRGPRQA